MHPLRIGQTFAAEVRAVDLRTAPDAALVEAIEAALAEHGVLVFRDQALTDAQQAAFIACFGPPPQASMINSLKEGAARSPYFFDVATVNNDGSPIDPDGPYGLYMRANLMWHTDGSQVQPPIRLTALSARQLPTHPPATEYADLRAAWEALDPATRARIDGLSAVHDIFHSRGKMGLKRSDFSPEILAARPPVVHPLVRTQPRTGRKALYLASHASHIVGLPEAEGRDLIGQLTAHATQPQFVYAHAWRPHDLVMWDDRWTMHRSTPYSGSEPRVLRWSGVLEREPV